MNDKQIHIASKLLKLDSEEIRSYTSPIEGSEAIYVSVPTKGGDSLIVSPEGEVLYANSSVSYDVHVREFLAGRRTPIEAFQ